MNPRDPRDGSQLTPAVVIQAQWAMWGKTEQKTGYHLMDCSRGPFTAVDFIEVICRYGIGNVSLPQATVSWVPDPAGGWAALAFHEEASGDRPRYVAGRTVAYQRMFAVRYGDLAAVGAGYTDLARALRDQALLPGSRAPLAVRVAAPASRPAPLLAAHVAALLLEGRPVGILDAEGVVPAERLAFIEDVASLLPYGMRSSLSASTGAAPNVQALKFRLFFSSAPPPSFERGAGRMVSWSRPETARPGAPVSGWYFRWLQANAGTAQGILRGITTPSRFTAREIGQVLDQLTAPSRRPPPGGSPAELSFPGSPAFTTAPAARPARPVGTRHPSPDQPGRWQLLVDCSVAPGPGVPVAPSGPGNSGLRRSAAATWARCCSTPDRVTVAEHIGPRTSGKCWPGLPSASSPGLRPLARVGTAMADQPRYAARLRICRGAKRRPRAADLRRYRSCQCLAGGQPRPSMRTMTRVRPTGFSLPSGFGVQWEYVESDKNVARAALVFLEDRRLLFGERHMEDERECVMSALDIRRRLTEIIPTASAGGGVEHSLRAIRAACTQFVNKAGPDGRNFQGLFGGDTNPFGLAIGELRSLVGTQAEFLARRYDLEVEEELLSIFPPPDQELAWMPGFTDGQ